MNIIMVSVEQGIGIIVSQVKLFDHHNIGITTYNLYVNMLNKIFSWDDKSESGVKAQCDPKKKYEILQ